MQPKFYFKSELALCYFPNSHAMIASAVRHLNRWIRNIPELVNALAAAGYRTNQKHFTRDQTALIFEYLGEP